MGLQVKGQANKRITTRRRLRGWYRRVVRVRMDRALTRVCWVTQGGRRS